MSRKLESLAQQLVSMGFSSERATLALILNEGKIEESVAWLFEGGEEADDHNEHKLDGGNLKIDISEELARIADMEIRYNCLKQEVERAIVACEGDLDRTAETLRAQKQDPPPSAPPKLEETGDPPIISNGKLSVSCSQNSLRPQPKPNSSAIIQQRRDDRDFNYTKTVATVGVPVESGSKNSQVLRKVQPKLEWAKPQQQIVMSADKRWPPSAASNPSVSYSMASPLQATSPPAKTETRYMALGSELKNLQLGSVKEPVVVMQRPQSVNVKQAPTTSMSSSPSGTVSGWYPNNVEVVKQPNGLSPHIPSMDSPGAAARGNGLWNRMSTSPTLAAASSLGLFSGLGSNGSSGSLSPVDWNTGGSTQQFDYTNIDWTLDRSSSRSSGMWQGMMKNNNHVHDSYTSGLNARTAMRPPLANGGLAGLQDGGVVASGETSTTTTGGGSSLEWSSPFEEKDLFSLPRQFVSSPSL
ncbi:hypothetical protein LOK49_LG15G02382 [Camellia lanceoleosa]|uniref:Uncharacterized protein n=1 Tax=Camellia lanceoleosa TaxID=1840588 RepID=A0ACC0F206_9ERIC|nr:hypothetical protein LOK49_LG15G02382 [Camellia lanceoleosa]